jgi:hypothetical protein
VVIFVAIFEIFVVFSQFVLKIDEFVRKYIFKKYFLQNGENLPQKKLCQPQFEYFKLLWCKKL